jgi:hypothetical protein
MKALKDLICNDIKKLFSFFQKHHKRYAKQRAGNKFTCKHQTPNSNRALP